MITVLFKDCNSFSQVSYDLAVDQLQLHMVKCTCGKSGCLIRYGSYKRNVQMKDEILTLTVVRVYCTACGRPHALLLSSLVPYSQIPLDVQITSIHAYESGHSLSRILADQCFIDENNLKAVIRTYRLHWKERLRSAGLSFAEWGSLVIGCFSHFSRQFMQIKTTINKLFLLPT